MHRNTPQDQIVIEPGFRPEHRQLVAAGYWEAFSRKLRWPMGPEDKALAFLQGNLDPTHAISAVSTAGNFLGVAGFKTPDGALVGGDWDALCQTYGRLSGTLRGLLLSALERDTAPDTLLMDGIFVHPAARSNGVGSLLLDAIERHAAAQNLSQVRLDVIDQNPRARALYIRQGFVDAGETTTGPLKHIFGFENVTKMIKKL